MGHNKPLTTVSGGYYTGMNLSQAKDKGKFKEIDRNGNNKLEEEEIILKRQEEVKDLRVTAAATMSAGAGMCLGALLGAPETCGGSLLVGIPAAISGLGGIALDAYAGKQEKITNQAIDNYYKNNPNSVFEK